MKEYRGGDEYSYTQSTYEYFGETGYSSQEIPGFGQLKSSKSKIVSGGADLATDRKIQMSYNPLGSVLTKLCLQVRYLVLTMHLLLNIADGLLAYNEYRSYEWGDDPLLHDERHSMLINQLVELPFDSLLKLK